MIRLLTEKDQEVFRALWLEAAQAAPSAFLLSPEEIEALPGTDIASQLASGGCWGLFHADQLAAFAVLKRCAPRRLNHVADLGPVVTRPAFQGCGYGKALLLHLCSWAKAEGILQIELCVDETNPAALALYQKLGFVEIGRRPRSLLIDGIIRNDLILLLCLDQD